MQKLSVLLQYIVPHHALTRFVGKIAQCQWPWVKDLFISWFIRRYHVDMSLAAEPNPRNYPSFNAFFTRALRTGIRPIATNGNVIISPVDGTVSQSGDIQSGQLFQAKGFHFTVASLLGNAPWAGQFEKGKFATIYLAPRDYHRIHIPFSGNLREMRHVPGRLFSVNALTTDNVPQLFSRNERVVALFDTAHGPMVVVMVGAMIVGSIATAWAGTVTPPTHREINHWQYSAQQWPFNKGAEIGQFMLGSTVIVLFANSHLIWESFLQPQQTVTMGQQIGTIRE